VSQSQFLLATAQTNIERIQPKAFTQMKPPTLNYLFLIAGLIGVPIFMRRWERTHHDPWLLGVGIFLYFVVSSLREILLGLKKR
jgi:hypothetical protein